MIRSTSLVVLVAAGFALQPVASNAQSNSSKKWSLDVSLYGLAAGMSGNITAKGVNADVDVGFDKIWENLKFGAMGKARLAYGPWALTTDVVYMDLGASKNGVSANLDQWLVEPTLSYRFRKDLEILAGARYNNISGNIRGPGILPRPVIATGTQDWWDPIVGANITLPLGKKFNFNVRGDIGGFGVGSDLTWQAFPYFGWEISKLFSLQAGYRWLYSDYRTGDGADRFKYDILTQGPQIGLTLSF